MSPFNGTYSYMRIVYDHKFGLQEQADFQYFTARLVDVKPEEYDWALENGWNITLGKQGQEWYQHRSTRCNLAEIDYSCFNDKHYKVGDWHKQKASIRQIYAAYCHYKGFQDLFSTEVEQWLDEDMLFEYYDDDEFVGWSKIRRYSANSLETVLFAWDYAKPEIHLGHNSLYHELAWAKLAGYKYAYMGPGYELGCLYKANVQGFEWWTGSNWSKDNQAYKRAVRKDSKIKTLEDLCDL